jgi:outer membrane murein-binding lipoprotein Lpp
MKKLFVAALAVGSVALASCSSATNYATKEYVDQQVGGVAEKVNSVDAKLSALEREVAALKSSGSGNAVLAAKINDLEAQINQMKNTCPEACNGKISALEKDIAELKEKVEKQSAHMEKEVEKSMRK